MKWSRPKKYPQFKVQNTVCFKVQTQKARVVGYHRKWVVYISTDFRVLRCLLTPFLCEGGIQSFGEGFGDHSGCVKGLNKWPTVLPNMRVCWDKVRGKTSELVF
jgi:hypothetical protein